ncbi:MAG TPA: DUF2330 domain-containing protein [Labilithrix sp.]|nr:DUF2330 domain-containing protein [Labilithrix sp.]
MRASWLLGGLVAAGALLAVTERPAEACGGCFTAPPPPPPSPRPPSVVTDHRMIVSVSQGQTTLYDELRYSGSPESFAWVLPISGTAKIGVSSDGVFSTLDAMTALTVVPPPQNCPPYPTGCSSGFSDEASPSAGSAADAGVSVTAQQTVGPYETVQLHASDGSSLNDWLTQHGYAIPEDIKGVVAQYVNEHFDFLALKLVPGQGVQAMRPVRVTTTGPSAVLPLRMVAAGTGANVGIVLWVVAEGRYEPQNFPFFQIKAEELEWDWTTYSSNLASLRLEKEATLGGRGWEHESSVSTQRSQLDTYLRNGFCPPYNGGGGYRGCQGAQNDYEAEDAGQDGGGGRSKQELQDEDLGVLLAGIPGDVRVTRVRAALSHASLDRDLVLQASADQSVLSPVRQVTREKNQPICTVYQGCDNVGSAPRDEAIARSGQTSESFSCAVKRRATRNRDALLTLGGFAALALVAAKRLRKKR